MPGLVASTLVALVAGWLGHLAITWLMLRAYDEEVDHDAANTARTAGRSTGDEVRASLRLVAQDRGTYGDIWELAEALIGHDERAAGWRGGGRRREQLLQAGTALRR